ncbi:hypothetical protein ABIB34_001996 [Rhodococcus sp. UYP5]
MDPTTSYTALIGYGTPMCAFRKIHGAVIDALQDGGKFRRDSPTPSTHSTKFDASL